MVYSTAIIIAALGLCKKMHIDTEKVQIYALITLINDLVIITVYV